MDGSTAADADRLSVLREMATEHVTYELKMLVVPTMLPHIQWPNDAMSTFFANSRLETMLLHLRNTVEFLVNPRPRSKKYESDIVADLYFDGGWTRRPAFVLGGSQAAHDTHMAELNQRLAHLTRRRRDDPLFTWERTVACLPNVVDTFLRFLDDLRSAGHGDRADWFGEAESILRQWRQHPFRV